MLQFVRREADILVATTIIESGLDIPNANTIFINQADNYGLADLHQLRGRVGRYKHRAYAYLLLDGERGVTPTRGRRLKAIEEFTELGAGFKIAMRDLEIRGAGNILGTQQMRPHRRRRLRAVLPAPGKRRPADARTSRCETPLEVDDRSALAGVSAARLRARPAAADRGLSPAGASPPLDRLEDFRQELRDRFGPMPEPAEWLLRLAELRLLAARWQVGAYPAGRGKCGSCRRCCRGQERLSNGENRRGTGVPQSSPHPPLGRAQRRAIAVVDERSAYLRLAVPEAEPLTLYAHLKELLRLPTRSL